MSHISSGYIYNSPSQKMVRATEAYEGAVAISDFNYANVSKDGLVDNTLTSVASNFSNPEVWRGYVNSNYPLFSESFLIDASAVFSGLVRRDYNPDLVASVGFYFHTACCFRPCERRLMSCVQWNILYQNSIPVTVYVNTCNAVVGYDYFFPVERTRVTTSFFNMQVGPVEI